MDQARFDTAAEYLEKADAQYTKVFGDDYYQRVMPLTKLGTVWSKTGEPEKAEIALRQALDVAGRSPDLGPKNETNYYGYPAVELSKVLTAAGRCPEVIVLLEEHVARWLKNYSDQDIVQDAKTALELCQRTVPEKL